MRELRFGTSAGRRAAAIAVVLSAMSGLMPGCSAPTAPPTPPGGGQPVTLSFPEFQTNVEPILTRQGCDAGGDCHGGGIRGTLQLSPVGAKDAQFDFDQVVLQVSMTSPDASPILTKPLALTAGGTPHSYKPFASTEDPDYEAIRLWILDGVGR